MRKHRDAPRDQDFVRFNQKVEAEENGCWLWTGAKDVDGYGRFWLLGRLRRAHRAAMFLFRGYSMDQDLYCIHSCDTPACVNPGHLSFGTQFDNMRDASAKGRTVNVNDWSGSKNPHSKLSPEQRESAVMEYRAALVDGRLPWGAGRDLVKKYGVKVGTIRRASEAPP